ncbi:MAG: nucleoside-diphosphate kinase [Gemmatimonadota bacterium]|nr:nucleoside-diphosphate kinase [Gemmatimonadota bacterium]
MNQTLAIIKPDAMESGKAGKILAHLEAAGFTIQALRLVSLSEAQAAEFYSVHKGKPFYDQLVAFMTSAPVIPVILEAENAVLKLRETIGATDPREAKEGTVRKLYAESKERNAIHASDSDANANTEIAFFFSNYERLGVD